jgi:3-hydroxybutyryl-CoA dehydrogenase
MTQDISTIAVVGAGVMGNGIAQVIASAGIDVMLADVDQRALERASERIDRSLRRQVAAGAITEAAAAAALERIEMTADLESAGAAADHVVETVVEDLNVKRDVLTRLDAVCRDDVVIASNTSQFSITRLAAALTAPTA